VEAKIKTINQIVEKLLKFAVTSSLMLSKIHKSMEIDGDATIDILLMRFLAVK
jgi:hypothetical protein